MRSAKTFLMAMTVLSTLVLSTYAQTPSTPSPSPSPSPIPKAQPGKTDTSKTDPQQGSIFNPQSLDVMSKKQYKATAPSDKYDPTHPDLKRTFNLSSKGFMTPAVPKMDQQALLRLPTFHGTAYNGTENSLNLPKAVVANTDASLYHQKAYTATAAFQTTPTFHVTGGKNNTFSRTFSVPSQPVFNTPPAYSVGKAYPDSNKTYTGPEASKEKQSVNELQALSSVSNVPDRTLTVDEVKSLLNRGHLPDDEEQTARPALPVEDPTVKPAEPLTLPQR